VAGRPGVFRVGRHQALLDGEDQLLSRIERGRRNRRIAAPEADLQRPDRFSQSKRGFGLVVQAQSFEVVEQEVGLREQDPSLGLRRHGLHDIRRLPNVKQAFTG
jgi:hypothetical protein